jgi:hypothetical protein
MKCCTRKVHTYKEYHGECPLFGIWIRSPTRSLASKCAPPPGTKGGHTRVRVRGWGSPNSNDWRKGLALCLLCGAYYHKEIQLVKSAKIISKDDFQICRPGQF